MFKLKEFYQYKREILKRNKAFQFRPSLDSRFLFLKNHQILQLKKQKPLNSNSQCILFAKVSGNNTILTLTDLKGKVIMVKSCGCLGFKGKKKRSTKFAIKSTIFSILTKIKELSWKNVILSLKGFGKGRYYLYESLKKSDLEISLISDNTSIPHNGCRPKKLRRN